MVRVALARVVPLQDQFAGFQRANGIISNEMKYTYHYLSLPINT